MHISIILLVSYMPLASCCQSSSVERQERQRWPLLIHSTSSTGLLVAVGSSAHVNRVLRLSQQRYTSPASGRRRKFSHGAAPPAMDPRRAPLAARQRLLRTLPTKRQDGAAELIIGPNRGRRHARPRAKGPRRDDGLQQPLRQGLGDEILLRTFCPGGRHPGPRRTQGSPGRAALPLPQLRRQGGGSEVGVLELPLRAHARAGVENYCVGRPKFDVHTGASATNAIVCSSCPRSTASRATPTRSAWPRSRS